MAAGAAPFVRSHFPVLFQSVISQGLAVTRRLRPNRRRIYAVQEVQEDGGNLWRNYPKKRSRIPLLETKLGSDKKRMLKSIRTLMHPLFMRSIHE